MVADHLLFAHSAQGRLAMVGFVAGAIREAQTSETLLQQAARLSPWTGLWLLLIVVASLQPITRAAKSEPFGRLWMPCCVRAA
jgi:hypothetical protein